MMKNFDWLAVCVMHTQTQHDQQNTSTFKVLMTGVLRLCNVLSIETVRTCFQ
jgi:hypothetical protein